MARKSIKSTKKETVINAETNKKNRDEKPLKVSMKSINFEGLNGKLLLVNVGNEVRPAEEADIKEIEGKLLTLLEENNIKCAIFVTHHAVSMNILG